MNLEQKLVDLVLSRVSEQDKRAAELMASGNLMDFGEYRHSSGYRKALHDVGTIITEAHEELMKE